MEGFLGKEKNYGIMVPGTLFFFREREKLWCQVLYSFTNYTNYTKFNKSGKKLRKTNRTGFFFFTCVLEKPGPICHSFYGKDFTSNFALP
jgi:hypothetical protein